MRSRRTSEWTTSLRGLRRERLWLEAIIFLNRRRERGVVGAPHGRGATNDPNVTLFHIARPSTARLRRSAQDDTVARRLRS